MLGKVVHCKRESYDVYIGRPSQWGNPFSHKQVSGTTKVPTRELAILAFRVRLWENLRDGSVTVEELAALHGKTLGCWCHPQPCHGDVLVAAAAWAAAQLDTIGGAS